MLFLMPNLLTATTDDITANVPLQKLLMYQLLHHKLPQNLLQRLLLLYELKRQKIQSTAHIKTESQRNTSRTINCRINVTNTILSFSTFANSILGQAMVLVLIPPQRQRGVPIEQLLNPQQ